MDSNKDNASELNTTNEQVELALTVARYDEVLSKCRLLRSRLMMTTADASGSGGEQEGIETYDALHSLQKMEEKFHYWSTQEEMLKGVKVSKLALEVVASDGPYDGLEQMLKEHCANQAKIFELAKEIRKEQLIHMNSSSQLLEKLWQYTESLKDAQAKLDSSSPLDAGLSPAMKKSLDKDIKDIRFMQICISQIIANLNVDLRTSKSLKEILKSARNPITSTENFL